MTSVQEMHTTCEDCGWRHAMTDSTNAKLRELRERVVGMPCYDSDGDPAGLFDHHVFVRREDVLRLIDAMIQEAGE